MEVNVKVRRKERDHQKRELKRKYKQEKIERQLQKQEKLENDEKQPDTEVAPKIATSKETTNGETSTISIAVPGSILEKAQSAELRTYVAGQIARAACIFKVDEIVVFDDVGCSSGSGVSLSKQRKLEVDVNGDGNPGVSGQTETISRSCLQMARILQYLECPQYLRKFFFPIHVDLKFSGLLNPLDAPHHLRQQNDFIYREGVVTNKPAKNNKGSFVNIGLLNDCLVDRVLTPGIRVTVKLIPNQDIRSKKLRGIIVSPSEPKLQTGVYWGYTVRLAKSFSEIFTKSPYPNGYDVTIGTSDKGTNIHSMEKQSLNYDHAIIVYGGLEGLEPILENEDTFDVNQPELIFDHYLNTVPGQGSRTIRTEEAILISLAALEEKFNPLHKCKEFSFSDSIAKSEDTGNKQFVVANKSKQGTTAEKCAKKMPAKEVDEDFLSRFD